MSEQDPNIGKIFEDRDSRHTGRRVQILEAFEKPLFYTSGSYPAYRILTVASPGYESAIGNKSSVSVENLAKRFREAVL